MEGLQSGPLVTFKTMVADLYITTINLMHIFRYIRIYGRMAIHIYVHMCEYLLRVYV